ncbi:MAG: hypothetical protein SGJ00_09605 [bacterium]|nr:hypothetical protein [bacterium]
MQKTIDRGSFFTTLSFPLNNSRLNAIWFTNTQTGFVFTDSNQMYGISNGGISWNILTTPITEVLNTVYFTSLDTG